MIAVTKTKAQAIADQLRRGILDGAYRPGDRMPSEQQLAREFAVTHVTVRRGLQKLVAEGLVTKRHGAGTFVKAHTDPATIALVLPDWLLETHASHPLIGLLVTGAQRALDQNTQTLSTFYYRNGALCESLRHILTRKRTAGMLLVPHTDLPVSDLERVMAEGIPVVLLQQDMHLAPLGALTVVTDRDTTLAQLMVRLIELGHRRIVVARFQMSAWRQQCDEVLGSLSKRYGLGDPADMVVDIPNADGRIDWRPVSDILDRDPRVTAIVAHDEIMAAEIFRECFRRGLRVPGDISLAAMSDLTPQIHPVPLTAPDSIEATMRRSQVAAEYLRRLIAGETPAERQVLLREDIRWNASIGPAPGGGVRRGPGRPQTALVDA